MISAFYGEEFHFQKVSTNQNQGEMKPGEVNCSTKAIIYSYSVGIDCKHLWNNCIVSEWTRGLSMSHVRVKGDWVLGGSAGSPTPAERSHRRLWARKDNTFLQFPREWYWLTGFLWVGSFIPNSSVMGYRRIPKYIRLIYIFKIFVDIFSISGVCWLL